MKQYDVRGMSCAACSARVEKAVSAVDGVTACSVSLLTNSMRVDGNADSNAVINAVKKAGYDASIKDNKKNSSLQKDELTDKTILTLKKRLIWSIAFLIILMYFSMGHMMLGFPLPPFMENNHISMGLVQLLITVIIMIINQKFFISGFNGLIHRAPNMDTLVSLGSGASFIYSLCNLFAMTTAQVNNDLTTVEHYMNEFYFESAAMILTLITLGKTLEAYSKGKTTNALKNLMKLAPKTAIIIKNNIETEVNIEEVKEGDIFVWGS